MKISIKKITNTKMIDKKDGSGQFPVNQVLTDNDEVLEIVGEVKVGQELEGEIEETQYGKRFKKAKSNFNKFSRQADPNSFIVSYAKDMVIAFINAGVIKTEKEAATQWINFSSVSKKIFDGLTSNKEVKPKATEDAKTPPKSDEVEEEVHNSEDEPEKDDILDQILF